MSIQPVLKTQYVLQLCMYPVWVISSHLKKNLFLMFHVNFHTQLHFPPKVWYPGSHRKQLMTASFVKNIYVLKDCHGISAAFQISKRNKINFPSFFHYLSFPLPFFGHSTYHLFFSDQQILASHNHYFYPSLGSFYTIMAPCNQTR